MGCRKYDSLRDLGDLLPTFTDTSAADLGARKQRAEMLAWRRRDKRASEAVELLVVQPVGGQSWMNQIGNAIRAVGLTMRDL